MAKLTGILTNKNGVFLCILGVLGVTSIMWIRYPTEFYLPDDFMTRLKRREVSREIVIAYFPATAGEVVATSKEETTKKEPTLIDSVVNGLEETPSLDPKYKMFGDGKVVLIQKRDNPKNWIRITRKSSEQVTIQHMMDGTYTVLFHYGDKNFVYVTSEKNAEKKIEVILPNGKVDISVFEGSIKALKKVAPAATPNS